ncbi:MAG: hypothetical protein ACLR07_02510 [Christensenellales bacterium]
MDAAGNLKHGLKAGTAPLRWKRKTQLMQEATTLKKTIQPPTPSTACTLSAIGLAICKSFLTVGFDPILYDDSNRQAQNAAKHAPIQ